MRTDVHRWVQIKTTSQLVFFVASIVVISLIVVNGLSYIVLSTDDFWANRLVANLEVLILAIPISCFVGLQIRKIYQLKSELEFALNHDPLTGAGTRAHMNAFLATDGVLPCPVILTDIDHFKQVNDQFGHLGGDMVLRNFVAMLERHTRQCDLIVRLGGEEFLIILPYTNFETGADIAEAMRKSIAQQSVTWDGDDIVVTASFGVGIICAQGSIDDAIRLVDEALYDAKNSGRNRVCLAPPVGLDTARTLGVDDIDLWQSAGDVPQLATKWN